MTTEIVTQAHALAAYTLAIQAHALAAQALGARAQTPAIQAQALATQAHALAAQALAAQAKPPAIQAQALTTQAHALATQAQVLANQAQVLAAQALTAPTYVADQQERKVFAYKEIANLENINLHFPFHKLALEDWEHREKFLRNSISLKKGQSNDLTNQIYSIFGIFAVFQGVVLSAVSQLKQTARPQVGAAPVGAPVCGKIWFPILLTSFATLATLVGIVDKFMSLHSLKTTIHKENQSKIEVADRANSLRREGPEKFRFDTHTDNSRPTTNPKFEKKWILVVLFFMIFTCIFILSYFVILCDSLVL